LTDDFDYSRFFALAEAFERSALRVNVVEPIDVDPWAVTRGEARIDVLRCECDEGRDALDLVGTTSAVLVLLSSRVIDALERGGFRGLRALPVEITCRGSAVDGYHCLAVDGRCGPVGHGEVVMPPFVPSGEPIEGWRGLYFDPKSWDGNDVFCPAGTGHVLVTEAVRATLTALGATNIDFTRITEWEIPRV